MSPCTEREVNNLPFRARTRAAIEELGALLGFPKTPTRVAALEVAVQPLIAIHGIQLVGALLEDDTEDWQTELARPESLRTLSLLCQDVDFSAEFGLATDVMVAEQL